MSRNELKVVLVGGSNTGKSGLIMRLITDKFMSMYDPTIEDSYNKVLSVDNEEILLDILDTAGQTQFAAMQQFWFREGEIFLIVYDITSSTSFKGIKHFIHKIAAAQGFDLSLHKTTTNIDKTPLKPFIIVGNKCDLEDKRKVSTEDGQQLADKYNVPFFECSSYTSQNLDEVWEESVRLHRRIQKQIVSPMPQTESKRNVNEKQSKSVCCGSQVKKRTTDNIQFFVVRDPLPDVIRPPILALKNFRISRNFRFKRFALAMICGALLPVVILFQTLAFLIYSENKEAWYYPEHYDYDRVHASILLDYLGLMVGREPGQDPETVRDRKWFLRQNTGQKIARFILWVLIAFAFGILYYNMSQHENSNVSRQETMGPLVLFCILWFLLSAWVAFEPQITPPLPPLLLSRLRSIELIFGEFFTHRTSAYKFLRAYAAARQENNFLSAKQYLSVIILSAIYALIPGITRATVGDANDEYEAGEVFWSKQNWMIEVGAFLVNFLLVSIFILAIEVQYSKHFDNYKDWMTDLTLLLSKEQLNKHDGSDHSSRSHAQTIRNVQEMIDLETSRNLTPHKFGRDFSKHLFLSLMRRSNALGWIEIRSFLAIEGKLLFGEQELPTLFLMIVTLSLSFFILFRVYFVKSSADQSILFYGASVLTIICLVSLIRIAITGYQFEKLQETQERLLGEQKLWMRCSVAQNIGVETIDVKLAAFGEVRSLSRSLVKKESEEKQIKEQELEQGLENEEEKEDIDIAMDSDNDIDIDIDNNNETQPLINETEIQVLSRVDATNWYTYNFGFIDDMIFIVRKKDIYPRLFKIKLNSVLAKAIAGVLFSALITFFKVFVQ